MKLSKVAVLTGATSGIGAELARQLARENFKLVIVCRDAHKAVRLRSAILLRNPGADTDFLTCRLDDLTSVRRCAEAISERYPVIDLLVANAGLITPGLQLTPQGIEKTFGVNHLAHFVLIAWLLPNLYRRARIVVTSSNAHYRARADFLDDINCRKRKYRAYPVYADSKLANTLFTLHLARMLAERGITVNCAHPGLIATKLVSDAGILARIGVSLAGRLFLKSPEEGARPLLKLARDPGVADVSGCYYAGMSQKSPSPHAVDEQRQKRLWQMSLQLAGDYLPENMQDF